MSEKSDEIWRDFQKGSEKFDYFIISLSGALFAYVGQSWKPEPLTNIYATSELAAIFLLALAVAAGLLHRKLVVDGLGLNHSLLFVGDQHTSILKALTTSEEGMARLAEGVFLSQQEASEVLPLLEKAVPESIGLVVKKTKAVARAYRTRNWLLVAGFIVLAISKFAQALCLTVR